MVNETTDDILYLEVEDVVGFYADLFGCSDQEASDQLRDREGLASALARPQHYAHYQQADLAQQAAVLAHGIAEGQKFIEGNKRVALIAMRTFLDVNGYVLEATQQQLARWIIEMAPREGESRLTPEELANHLRSHIRRGSPGRLKPDHP